MKPDCGFVIYVINRILLQIKQDIKSKYHKCCEKFIVFVKQYELNKTNLNDIDLITDSRFRGCCYNYFHTFKNVYDVEMGNGHSFISIRSDKK